ncbi:MAG TPA: riboflavin synthase [Thermotogota bacterium]|nr:riboflavin synthase [Thermotogota bacterium]
MFTGLIEEIGTIRNIFTEGQSSRLTIRAEKILQGIHYGDSVAVNGVCLTVSEFKGKLLTVDVMPETFRRSTLKNLRVGQPVNLERALKADGRFGGHIVSGHVDGTGIIRECSGDGIAKSLSVQTSESILAHVVFKGSVCLDGVSLTVIDVSEGVFIVSIIPTTREKTTLSAKRPGDELNIECDLIGKYIRNVLLSGRRTAHESKNRIDENFLNRNGFV